jgi:hypothetical protein
MRNVFMSLLLILYYFSLAGQLINERQQLTSPYYPQKSNSQKTWGTILTVGGAILVISGALVYGTESGESYFPSREVGTGLMIGGGVVIVGGIILLRASSRNNSKAEEFSMRLNLALETTTMSQKQVIRKTHYPALGINIRL